MKLLSLNCQRGLQPGLKGFLQKTFESGEYDFIILQEFADEVPSYVRGIRSYHLLHPFNDELRKPSSLCIAYRPSVTLQEHQFRSYAAMHYDPALGFKHPHLGFLQGRFEHEGKSVLVGSLHLHSGVWQSVRIAQIQRAKREVAEFRRSDDMVIFGGDCNTGYPGEAGRLSRVLAPEFVQATRDIGGTLNSRYTEYYPHLPNRLATTLAKLGLGVKLKTDLIFVDQETVAGHSIRCRILPERVSDHSPVEMELT